MVSLKSNSRFTRYLLAFFAVLSMILIVLFAMNSSIYNVILFSCMFAVSLYSLWLNDFTEIILSDTEFTVKTIWPFSYFPLTHTFKINDIEKVIITRSKYLSEFLYGNQDFERIRVISNDTVKERLTRKLKWFDYDMMIGTAMGGSLYGEDIWVCVLNKDSTLFMTMCTENHKDLYEILEKRGIETIYKLSDTA